MTTEPSLPWAMMMTGASMKSEHWATSIVGSSARVISCWRRSPTSCGTVYWIVSPTPSSMTPSMPMSWTGSRSTSSLVQGVIVWLSDGRQVTQVTVTVGMLVGLATSALKVTVSPTSASAQSTPSPLSM